jgi:hypothetical protein
MSLVATLSVVHLVVVSSLRARVIRRFNLVKDERWRLYGEDYESMTLDEIQSRNRNLLPEPWFEIFQTDSSAIKYELDKMNKSQLGIKTIMFCGSENKENSYNHHFAITTLEIWGTFQEDANNKREDLGVNQFLLLKKTTGRFDVIWRE